MKIDCVHLNIYEGLIWSGKGPDAGKNWRQEEKGMTEDEMVGWHHQLDGHEFEQAPGVGDGQGSQEWCGPWGCNESDMSEQLNWTVSISKSISTELGLGRSSRRLPRDQNIHKETGTRTLVQRRMQPCLIWGQQRKLSHTVGWQEEVTWCDL